MVAADAAADKIEALIAIEAARSLSLSHVAYKYKIVRERSVL
jgi:hypothetical protein